MTKGVVAFPIIILLIPVYFGGNDAAVWLATTVLFCIWAVFVPQQFNAIQSVGLLFICAVGVASVLLVTRSIAPTVSLVGVLRMAGYLGAFAIATAYSRNVKDARLIAEMLFWGIVAHAIWALISLTLLGDTLLLGPKEAYSGFATGTYVNRSSFATLLGIGLVLGLARMTPPRLIGAAVLLVTLILTGSRAGVATAALGVLIVIALNGGGWRKTLVAATVLVVIIFCVGAVLLDRLIVAPTDAGDRIALYRNSLAIIGMRPWTGFGLDSFPLVISQYRAPYLGVDLVWDRAHNTLLSHWVEMGLILGSVPVVLALMTARQLVAGLKSRRGLAAPALAVLIAALAHAMLDFGLEMAGNVYVFLLVIAIGLPGAAGRTVRNEYAG